jgi:hypothetical protein
MSSDEGRTVSAAHEFPGTYGHSTSAENDSLDFALVALLEVLS